MTADGGVLFAAAKTTAFSPSLGYTHSVPCYNTQEDRHHSSIEHHNAVAGEYTEVT